MSIQDVSAGNLLDDDAQALVNTVNCVGVMGKGLALAFKKRFPENYLAYRSACLAGVVHPGYMHCWWYGKDNSRLVINFPTKQHWRDPSQLAWIKSGLVDLIAIVDGWQIQSIAVPALGCANGGLNWTDVKPLIVDAFASRPEVLVRLYPPR